MNTTKHEKKETEKKEITPTNVVDVKKNLAEQIKKFEELNTKISHREKFLDTLEKLKTYKFSLNAEKEKNNFETEAFFLRLSSKVTYREEDIISISNVQLIERFIVFISAEIEAKILQLETEILQ